MVVRLKFNQKIFPSAGKPIAVSELVKRLKDLHNELSRLDQVELDLASLDSVAKDLIQPQLVTHKDKGVRAYVAVCLADVFRLYAPNPPYGERQLKEAFQFFLKQLELLRDNTEDNAFFQQQYYLLESLSTVRSILCLADIHDGQEELVRELFNCAFRIIRPDHSKNVFMCLLDILQQVVEEFRSLPVEAVEAIVSRFEPQKEKNTAAFDLAVDLCKNTAEFLQRYFATHFSDIILRAKEENDVETVISAHKSIVSIHRSAPAVLDRLIPVLEDETMTENDQIRLAATDSLGQMLFEKGSTLAKAMPTALQKWLGRAKDKDVMVRLKMIERVSDIYRNHPDFTKDADDILAMKARDPDDRVRTAVVHIISKLDPLAISHLGTVVLRELEQRCKDKKTGTRHVAIKAMGRIFKLSYAEMTKSELQPLIPKKSFSWIPGAILELLYLNESEVTAQVEKVLAEDILESEDVETRVSRLLWIVTQLNDNAYTALIAVIGKQPTFSKDVSYYLDICSKYNRGIIDDGKHKEKPKSQQEQEEREISRQLNEIQNYLAERLGDPKKTLPALQKFSTTNDRHLYELIRKLISAQMDLKQIAKTTREILRRIEEMNAALVETFATLLRRTSLAYVQKDSVPYILEHIKEGKTSASKEKTTISVGSAAEKLFKSLMEVLPEMFKSHVSKLNGNIVKSDVISSDSLEALARVAKADQESLNHDAKAQKKLIEFIFEGDAKQAKNAAIVLCHEQEKESLCRSVLKRLSDDLHNAKDNLESHLAALGQIARYLPRIFESRKDDITKFVIQKVLMKNRSEPDDVATTSKRKRTPVDEELEWVDDDELPEEVKCKVAGLKLLVKWVEGVATINDQDEDTVMGLFKVLWTVLSQEGELVREQTSSAICRSRMRVTASLSLFRLARNQRFEAHIENNQFINLSLTIQDSCFQARERIANKLMKYIHQQKLPIRFLTVLMLSAHEPERELFLRIKSFLTRKARDLRAQHEQNQDVTLVEHTFVRLIYLLSHHPDMGLDYEELRIFSQYVEVFLDAVATKQTISFLFHSVQRLKIVRDITSESSQYLYTLSDMAQYLIQERAKVSQWPIQSYQAEYVPPKSLFKLLKANLAQENAKKTYLPTSFVTQRQLERVKAVLDAPKRRRSGVGGNIQTATSARATKAQRTPNKPKKRRKPSVDEDNEATSDVGESSDNSAKASEPVVRRNAKRQARPDNVVELDDGEDTQMETNPSTANGKKQRKTASVARELEDMDSSEPILIRARKAR
ncbi:hypothetical protein M427DRAFT_340606 [Gonapodya prolifera JEL478]|uniref:ARM repeat-containing protein n=1 Tax=Gonapodya prolifera (strain JEL478) TaxID=1344416 RepID=A0A139ACQ8_GONPJ|nr:hypothetical protein M427DRAFT_340606 [Gonapodya prolifera JEL478]|eukprot:KXS14364.1 hypothetical protein M427DRAFT_340606 [Gonapodya prolifera JEL478]